MRIVFTIILVLLAAYAYIETRRWRSPELKDFLTPAQKRRRVTALLFLGLISIMVIGGSYLPTAHISRRVAAYEVLYWSICPILALIVPILAVREVRDTLKQENLTEIRHERDVAYKEMVETVAKAEIENKRRTDLPTRNGHG
jgi:hypothetical protein